MSDRAEGFGWWLASDGKWYAPELHPDRAARAGLGAISADGPGHGASPRPGWWVASDGNWYAPELHPDFVDDTGVPAQPARPTTIATQLAAISLSKAPAAHTPSGPRSGGEPSLVEVRQLAARDRSPWVAVLVALILAAGAVAVWIGAGGGSGTVSVPGGSSGALSAPNAWATRGPKASSMAGPAQVLDILHTSAGWGRIRGVLGEV